MIRKNFQLSIENTKSYVKRNNNAYGITMIERSIVTLVLHEH